MSGVIRGYLFEHELWMGNQTPSEFALFQRGRAPSENLVLLAFQLDQAWGQGHYALDVSLQFN